MNPEIERIVREMCRRVGADFDTLDFEEEGKYDSDKKEWIKKPWYMQHEWTLEEEADFKVWLMEELKHPSVKNAVGCVATDKQSRKTAAMWFLVSHGWSTKNEV
jgi:hypothetical protein